MRTLGRYRLVELLASGGMADVWRAEMTSADGVIKEVALKLIRGEHGERSGFAEMFVEEARLAALLTHANVVQLFEYDQAEGRRFISMELVRGRHLGQVLERARERGLGLGVARAVYVGAEVAKALAYAHGLSYGGRPLGIVHRDVSPQNVLVSFEGEVKLADFGIARAAAHFGFTDSGTVKGKLAYMAPEQARGGPVDERADLFSLGVILWEMCSGRRLLARSSEGAMLDAVLGDEPFSPPSAWNAEVPVELDEIVMGAIERNPARRIRSARELATALATVLIRSTRAPGDVDLRSFVRSLFADELEGVGPGRPTQEPTRAGPSTPRADPLPLVEAGGGGDTGTLVLRSWPSAPSRRRLARSLMGLVITAILAASWATWRREAPGAAESAGPRERSPSPLSEVAVGEVAGVETPGRRRPPDVADPPGKAGARAGPSSAGSPLERASALGRLRTPSAESGDGILSVNATPWGFVVVDGVVLGESPQELRVRAGPHRVRVDRRNQRGVEQVVTVVAGRRKQILR